MLYEKNKLTKQSIRKFDEITVPTEILEKKNKK